MSALESLRDLAALAVTFGLTGWLLGLVALPERLGVIRRGGLSLALSVPATLAISVPGLILHRLGLLSLAPGLCLLAAAAWRARRGARDGPRTERPTIPRIGAVEWRRLLLVSACAALGWFAVVLPQIALRRTDGLPRDTTVWYYWWLVDLVERTGGLPSTIPEWGADRPFPLEYLAATVHGAATAALSGGADLALMESYRLAVAVLGLLASFALWRRFLPAWWAWIAAILSMSAIKVASRLAGYRPETVGFVLVLWSGWLLDEALERRSARWGVVAGVVSASAFLAHAEIWLLTGPLWLGIGAGRVARSASRAGWWRRALDIRPLLQPVVAGVLSLLLGVGGVSLATGSVGRILAIASVPERGADARPSRTGDDPTWALFAAIARPDAMDEPPPPFCTGIWLNAAETTRQPFAGVNLRDGPTRIALVLAAVLALLPIPRVPPAVRWMAVAWGVYVLGVYAGSRTFCAAYDTFIPRRAGPVRIMPYYALALAGLFAALGWLGASLLTAGVRRIERRGGGSAVARLAARLPATVLSIGLLLLFSPLARGPVVEPSTGLAPTAYQAYRWIDRHLPPDAVVMTNAYTPGAVGALAGTYGWTDGRAPYLESPEWRAAATRALLDARAFFREPRANRRLLPRDVDYLLVAAPGVSLGGSGPFPADTAGLGGLEGVRLVRAFGGGAVRLYEVARTPG